MGAPDILEIIAQRDDLDKYAISQLAQSNLDSVRALIAKKPNLNDSLIKMLADDKSFIVRVMISERDDIDDALVIGCYISQRQILGSPRSHCQTSFT